MDGLTAQPAEGPAELEPTAPPWRLLLADDDETLRRLVRMLLERDGRFVVVGEAADGGEALDLVDRLDPDLLLLDLAMPHVDGLQVLERIGHQDRPTIAVLTGFTDDALCAQVIEAGASRCLRKGTGFRTLPDELATVARGG